MHGQRRSQLKESKSTEEDQRIIRNLEGKVDELESQLKVALDSLSACYREIAYLEKSLATTTPRARSTYGDDLFIGGPQDNEIPQDTAASGSRPLVDSYLIAAPKMVEAESESEEDLAKTTGEHVEGSIDEERQAFQETLIRLQPILFKMKGQNIVVNFKDAGKDYDIKICHPPHTVMVRPTLALSKRRVENMQLEVARMLGLPTGQLNEPE